jgi:hypothetical protein
VSGGVLASISATLRAQVTSLNCFCRSVLALQTAVSDSTLAFPSLKPNARCVYPRLLTIGRSLSLSLSLYFLSLDEALSAEKKVQRSQYFSSDFSSGFLTVIKASSTSSRAECYDIGSNRVKT